MSRILFIEDNLSISDLAAEILGSNGHNVFPTYDGKMALAALEAKNPDMMFVDCNMPGMDGREFMEILLNNPVYEKYRAVPRVSIGDFTEAEKQAYFNNNHLQKPFTPKQLAAKVDELLTKQ